MFFYKLRKTETSLKSKSKPPYSAPFKERIDDFVDKLYGKRSMNYLKIKFQASLECIFLTKKCLPQLRKSFLM